MYPAPSEFSRLNSMGRGAIATIVVWGPAFAERLEPFFVGTQKLGGLPANTIRYGQWCSPLTNSTPEDIVISRADGPEWYVYSHGGAVSQSVIAKDLIRAGFEECPWQDRLWHQSKNFWEWQIQLGLCHAATHFVATTLIDQLSYWSNWIKSLLECIDEHRTADAIRLNERILRTAGIASHLLEPWRIAFCGRPNVGKSHLMNSILGFERAIVSPIAGTTRDLVEHVTVWRGWPLILQDLAGIRNTTILIEQMGIAKGRVAAQSADCLVGVFDAGLRWNEESISLANELRPHKIVFNKCDIRREDAARPAGIFVSALTGENIESLMDSILESFLPPDFELSQPLAFAPSMVDRVRQIQVALASGDLEQARLIVSTKS